MLEDSVFPGPFENGYNEGPQGQVHRPQHGRATPWGAPGTGYPISLPDRAIKVIPASRIWYSL